ncbi:MAG: 30S ribosomal protein S8 [Patescibacteria group bacterium]|nr:30S ribosomal protein S8 [Patescibacteria group bacterium]MDE2589731.1 30S ribosomal protein S8 [Patescibacteria group bacterium]
MNYTLGDFVIRIKNAVRANRKTVVAPATKTTKAIAKLLVKEGILKAVKEVEQEGKPALTAEVAFDKRTPVFTDVRIISKPSLRVYASVAELAVAERRGLGKIIVSTNSGMMTGKEALKKGLGGELLFEIW